MYIHACTYTFTRLVQCTCSTCMHAHRKCNVYVHVYVCIYLGRVTWWLLHNNHVISHSIPTYVLHTSYLLTYIYMALIIHEMLRKMRQGNKTQQKDKATQYNLSKVLIFKETLGRIRTYMTLAFWATLFSTELLRQLSWLGWITYTNEDRKTKAPQP